MSNLWCCAKAHAKSAAPASWTVARLENLSGVSVAAAVEDGQPDSNPGIWARKLVITHQ